MHGWENLHEEDEAAILKGISTGLAHGGPYHVEIDAIDRCNVACFFCGSADLHQGGVLSWDVLGPRVEELIAGGLRSFRMAGGGEPLIYPHLDLLCDRMADAGVVMDDLTTNGVRVNNTIESLLRCKMTKVLYSLNYSNSADYGRYMRTAPAKFDLVVDNIRLLHDRLTSLGRRQETQIHTQFFLHKGTVEALPEMIDLAMSLPVELFTIRAIGGIPGEEVIPEEGLKRLKELLPGAVARTAGGPWIEVDLSIIGLQPFADEVLAPHRHLDPAATASPHNIEYCYIPWYSMAVRGSGDVHPCCFLMPNPAIPSLGNFNKQTVSEIWNGPNYRQFRHEMRTVMMMEEPVPLQHRRFRCTVPGCWKHDACPLAFMMATPDFYQRAHEQIRKLRARPVTMATRAANRVTRQMIDGAKRVLAKG